MYLNYIIYISGTYINSESIYIWNNSCYIFQYYTLYTI